MAKLTILAILVAAVAWLGKNQWNFHRSIEILRERISLAIFGARKEEHPLPPPPPENVFYTREKIDYALNPGRVVLEPGTAVRKIGEGGGKYVVEHGNDRLVVDPAKLTREPVEIDRLLRMAAARDLPGRRAAAADLKNRLADMDRKLGELRHELLTAAAREESFRKAGRSVPMGTSTTFLQNEITRLESSRRDLARKLESLQPPPPPSEPGTAPGGKPD